MGKSQDNSNGNNVPVVEEIGNWITTKRAAELMRVELPSVGAIIHSGKVKACKIAGVILVEKASASAFGKEREAQVLAETATAVCQKNEPFITAYLLPLEGSRSG